MTTPTFDMPDHQRHIGAAGGGDNVPPLFDRGGDRFFDQDVNAARDAGERDLVMQMRRRGNGDGIDPFRGQLIQASEGAAARQFGRPRPVRRQRIDHADQRGIGQAGQHPGVIAPHDPGADHPDTKRTLRLGLAARCGQPFGTHMVNPSGIAVLISRSLS